MSDPIVYGDSEAMIGLGAILHRNGVEIAEVNKITPPGFSADAVDVTHLRSPGAWREFIAGVKDGGELTFDVNLIPSNASQNGTTGVLSAYAGDGPPPRDTWTLVFPDADATTWTFPGFVSAFEPGDLVIDDKMMASITVKIAGRPTLA